MREQDVPSSPRAPFPCQRLFMRCAPAFIDEAEHYLHDQDARAATLIVDCLGGVRVHQSATAETAQRTSLGQITRR